MKTKFLVKAATASAIESNNLEKKDLAYKILRKAGAKWGGNWHTVKDYQHFEFQ